MSISTRQPLLVSEARARFSSLVEEVTEHPGTAVVISHRDRKTSAVLVDAAHYEVLKRKAHLVDNPPGEPFEVVGSLKILVSDEELEAGIAEERRRQARLAEARFSDL